MVLTVINTFIKDTMELREQARRDIFGEMEITSANA